jgi:hypothetical protein
MKDLTKKHNMMTLNVLTTMALSFIAGMIGLLVLASASTNQAIVGGVLAMGAGFINLVRRAPEEVSLDEEMYSHGQPAAGDRQ